MLFDLDGTLIKYSVDRLALTDEMFRYLKSRGLFFDIYGENDYPITLTRKTRWILESMNLPRPLISDVILSLFKIIDRYEVMATERTSVIDGAYAALDLVKSMSLKCGLFTLNGRHSTFNVLKKFGFLKYFEVVVTRDDVKYLKPNPEHLMAAINLLGIKPEETVVVGDSTLDVIPAAKLNALPVAVKSGVRSVHELRAAGAKIILDSVSDFPSWFRSFFESDFP